MTTQFRILIHVCATTFFLGLVSSAPAASAASGDPMSRDVEFRESLGRKDNSNTREPVIRFLSRRTGTSKQDSPPK